MVDYTEHINGAISAQGNERNVLILRKLDKKITRFDGKKAGYEIEYRWLSRDCISEDDESFVCIQGQEFTYWTYGEIKPVLKNKDILLDFFYLF